MNRRATLLWKGTFLRFVFSTFLLISFQQDPTLHSSFISGKLLYMFWAASAPIIRSTLLYLQYLVLVKPLLLPATILDELELD